MALRKVERMEWRAFCDRMSRSLVGKRAAIEVASPEIGVHYEARWLPVIGVTYDPDDDIVQITLEGFDHMIFHPRELYADLSVLGLESLGIVDDNSAWQIVLLREPLMLPAPQAR